VARTCSGDRSVILDTNQQVATVTIGEAHHRLNEAAIMEASVRLAFELDRERLPAGNHLSDLRGFEPTGIRRSCHGQTGSKILTSCNSTGSRVKDFDIALAGNDQVHTNDIGEGRRVAPLLHDRRG
jgi:hypothetical protein